MRILILDDEQSRHDAFVRHYGEHHALFHAYGTVAAIELMQEHTFDLIYLDHDLGEKIFDPYPREITGDDVARWMTESLLPQRRPALVIVHSWNPDGARRIANRLHRANFNVRLEPFNGATL